MKWWSKKTTEQKVAKLRGELNRIERRKKQMEKQRNCPHYHTQALGTNRVGFVTCTDCGAEIGMDDAYNIMEKRFQKLISGEKIAGREV